MKDFTTALLSGVAALAFASSAMADGHGCSVTSGSVRILGNEFPAIQTIAAKAQECVSGDATFASNLTKDHRDIQVAALTPNPAEYTSAIVANGSIVPLMNDGLIRPLDDLVAKHAPDFPKSQLITINGQIMAVAFMANAQHLFYREDILAEAGVEVPTSYEDVLAAAKAIKDKGLLEYPLSGTYKAGWNLGEEFVNMYMGTGASMFEEGTASPAINNENGIAALNMMKALSEYMNPDFLTYDSNAAAAEWEAGNVAIMNMWGSRAGPVTDDEGSTPEIVAATKFAAAPTLGEGPELATTLWWDGFTIAANISDEDAEATFIALMNGINDATANANPEQAVWLSPGYKPSPAAAGVFASASATPYPMVPYGGLMHTALGAELTEFMQGNESAEQALADVEAAYTAAAKEAGFIQ
ncbi:MAG: extracellular solute-binding protein [Litoreibacter sp.]|nr:extracellular solute-binding protein [Litoreibacter sp.]